MPILGWVAGGLASFVIGIIYEKATDDPVIDSSTANVPTWWDKTLLVVLGLGAYYIYKKVK